MKLSELHPCDGCGGPLLKPGQIQFYVIRSTSALVSPRAFNEVRGLSTYFQGALGLAEVFAPEPDVVKLVADEKIDGQDGWREGEILCCFDCYCEKPVAHLVEARNDRREAARAAAEEKAAAAE